MLISDSSLETRLAAVRERIEKACARARRDPATVRLLAVTKVFPADAIRDAYALGLREFGENYVQEMETKAPLVADLAGARFHLIGHLQSNKTKRSAQLFQAIDSVDSLKLARRLDAEGVPLDVMIEVRLAAGMETEAAKTGADPAEVPAILDFIRSSKNLTARGLMTVPPWSEDAETARPYFAQLREMGEKLGLSELSMGMSNDLEVAIEEGSTWVRVGTALFGKRKKV